MGGAGSALQRCVYPRCHSSSPLSKEKTCWQSWPYSFGLLTQKTRSLYFKGLCIKLYDHRSGDNGWFSLSAWHIEPPGKGNLNKGLSPSDWAMGVSVEMGVFVEMRVSVKMGVSVEMGMSMEMGVSIEISLTVFIDVGRPSLL